MARLALEPFMGHDYMVIATIVDHFGLILESYQSNGDWVITDPVSKFQCRLRLNEAKKTQRFSRAPQDGLPQPGQTILFRRDAEKENPQFVAAIDEVVKAVEKDGVLGKMIDV